MRDFQCPLCGRIEEDVIYDHDSYIHKCSDCGADSNRVILPGRGPGIMTHGRGVRSSGEALDRGTRRLAAMSFGPCLETGKYVDTSDGRREPVMRPIQTEGELDRELTKRNLRRGTVNEANQRFEEMKATQGKKKKPEPRPLSEEVQQHIHQRPAIFRSQYDAGAIPRKEIPADVAERIPKRVKGV